MNFAGKLSASTCSGQNKTRIACAAISFYHRLANAEYYPKSCSNKVKSWEIIADRLKKAGWSLGWVSAVDSQGRTIWIVDTHRGDGQRFVVHADEKLTAFLELESVTRESLRFQNAEQLGLRRILVRHRDNATKQNL